MTWLTLLSLAASADDPRAVLEERLRELAASPAPTDLEPGAMCYKPVAPPQGAVHVCPVCGARTEWGDAPDGPAPAPEHHADGGWSEVYVVRHAPEIRAAVAALKGPFAARLDESALCRRCSPEAPAPELVLIVAWSDARVVRTPGVTLDDIRLIAEFLAGSDRHVHDNDGQAALSGYAPRVAALLGLTPPPAP